MKKVLSFFFLFLILVSISYGGNTLNFTEDFSNTSFTLNTSGGYTGSKSIYFKQTDNRVNQWIPVVPSATSRFENVTNPINWYTTPMDGFSNNSIRFYITANPQTGKLYLNFTGCNPHCHVNADTKIIFDYIQTGDVWLYHGNAWFWGIGEYAKMTGSVKPNAFYQTFWTDVSQECMINIGTTADSYAVGRGWYRFNHTLGELYNSHPYCADNINYSAPVDSFIITMVGTSYDSYPKSDYFDNFQVYGLLNGSNNLPSGEISIIDEADICINTIGNYTRKLVNFTIDGLTDTEDDPIKIGYQNLSATTQTYNYDTNGQYCFLGLCAIYPDTTIANLNTSLSTCVLNTNPDSLDTTNAVNYIIRPNEIDQNIYMLDLNYTYCDTSYLMKLPAPTQHIRYGTSLFNLDRANESVTFQLESESNTVLSNLTYKVNETGTGINVYHNGVKIGNFSVVPYYFELIYSRDQINHISYSSYLSTEIPDLVITPISQNAHYLRLLTNGNAYIDHLELNLNYRPLEWVNESDFWYYDYIYTGMTGSTIKLYLSDSEHYPTEYTVLEKNFKIKNCVYVINNTAPGGMNLTNSLTEVDPLGTIKALVGTNFKDYLIALDVYETGEKLLYWVFIVLLVGFLVSGMLMFHHFNLIFPLFSSSAICGLIAFLAGFPSFLVFLLFMSFALGIPLASSFLGGGGKS